jgi:hypothetical protein
MNLKQYRTLFMLVTLVFAVLAASPIIGLVIPFGSSSEQFSELWLLGPTHMLEDYPLNVGAGEEYLVFAGVDNNMGNSEYYMVSVNFCNSSSSISDIAGSVPDSLFTVYNYQFFVGDGESCETPVTFGFQDVFADGDVLFVGDIIIDDLVFPVDVSVQWDSEGNGFFFQLFFELWRYDVNSQTFCFHDRVVGLWLNMSSTL